MNKRKHLDADIEEVVRAIHYPSQRKTLIDKTENWSSADFDHAIDRLEVDQPLSRRGALRPMYLELRAERVRQEQNDKITKRLQENINKTTTSKTERYFCNKCRVVTSHSVNVAKEIKERAEDYSGSTKFEVLVCATCSDGTFRKRVWFSEDQDPNPHSQSVYADTYYPPRIKRPLPEWHDKLPQTLRQVLYEAYTAFQYDLRYIAAVGFRTALDIAVVEKVSDIGSFPKKLTKMVTEKHITEKEKELILAVSESGDAAAHRGFQPSGEEVVTLTKVLERLLHQFYVKNDEDESLHAEVRKVRARVPPRPKNEL